MPRATPAAAVATHLEQLIEDLVERICNAQHDDTKKALKAQLAEQERQLEYVKKQGRLA